MKALKKFVFTCCLFQAVWCREFIISLPESVEALRGLCVLIPCSFDFKEQYDVELQNNPRGVWYKGDSLAKYKVYSSKNTEGNKIEGKILGDLQRKNCTTVFYNISESDSGDYYFRIVSGNLKYIYSSSLYLNIRASPISPSITLYKEDQGELEVQNEVLEGTSLSLICSARSPCPFIPPIFSWNFMPEERRAGQNHNTRFSSSQLNFIASHLHHGLQFSCTATYQLQNQNKSAQSSHTLQVLYAPRNTSVSASPSASVLLGSSVSLSCSSDANPAVLNFTWYRENGEQIGTGNHLAIDTTDSTHSGLYYCRAQNQHGYQKASVHLDLQYAPQVSSSSSCNNTPDLIMCSCEVDGNPVPTLEWHLSIQTALSTREESVNNTTLRSFISIPQSFTDMLSLQCVGSNKLGIDTQLFYLQKEPHLSAEGSGVHVSSVLIGAAVGASAMMMLCVIILCVRRVNPFQSGGGDRAELTLNNSADGQEDGELVYANGELSSESLHYSTIMFSSSAGGQFKGSSSLTAEYDSKQHHEGRTTDTEAKERDTKQLQHSADVIYAQVKPQKREGKVRAVRAVQEM